MTTHRLIHSFIHHLKISSLSGTVLDAGDFSLAFLNQGADGNIEPVLPEDSPGLMWDEGGHWSPGATTASQSQTHLQTPDDQPKFGP